MPEPGTKGNLPMFPLDPEKLTPQQQVLVDMWEAHLKAEFQDKDACASCDTMVSHPSVNHGPVLTGGVGRRQLEHFYGRYFIPATPSSASVAAWRFNLSFRRVLLAPAQEERGEPPMRRSSRVKLLFGPQEERQQSPGRQ
jgi:hypothetical protein